MLDLNGFKRVNDLYGHAEGDRLLHAVARALELTCRDEDILCRVGGDEFAIVLPGAGTTEAKAVGERLAATVRTADSEVGASIGLAQWPDDGPDKEALLLRADISLYSAKRGQDDATSFLSAQASRASSRLPAARRTDQAAAAPEHSSVLAGIDRYPRWTVVAASAALAALVLLARSAVKGNDAAVLVLLVVPVALLAVRFALLGGVVGAAAGVLLLASPSLYGGQELGPLGYVTRSVTFLTIGVLVGYLSGQARRARSLLQRRVERGIADVAAARNAAEEERDFLAAVLESLDEGIVACDAHGGLSFFNDATRRLHGLPARAIPAAEWAEHYDIFSADGTTLMPAEEIPLMRAFAGEAIRDVPMVVAPAGKEPRTIMATGRPIVDADGRKSGAVVAMRDVTEQLHLQRRLQHAMADAMLRLARAVEYRDTVTGKHLERMSHSCRLLAERAGLAPERCAMIEVASRLHDVGKIAVPDAVLLKPGKLDAKEWKLMEAHTVTGHELLAGSGSEVLDLAATIALSHHERIDGTGYPHGLRGDAIPIEARMAAIADAFDALTSDRPYRSAFTTREALDIIARERGTHFDAELLDLFDAELLDLFVAACPSAVPPVPAPDPVGELPIHATAGDQHTRREPEEQIPSTTTSMDLRVRDCVAEAAADLSDYFADVQDNEFATRERVRIADTRGAPNGDADDRQPSRDRRWAADDRVRAAARRAPRHRDPPRQTSPEPDGWR